MLANSIGVELTGLGRPSESAAIDLAREADFALGAVQVRPSLRAFIVDGREELIEPRIMQVLVVLARRRGEVVTRDDLMAQCWGGRIVGEDSIQRPVAKIRRLGEESLAFSIETIPRVGYRLKVEGDEARVAEPVLAAPSGITLAVLPFHNLSPDPDEDYFSDGLSEELISQLAQIRALRVAGRTSSFAFKDKADDIRAIGEKLGVDYVLEGGVRRAGQKLRITAQLVKCSDGFQLWSERFDRDFTDVFQIQDEIARAVASALSVTLGIGESTRLPGGTSNLEAYDRYLRARALYHQSGMAELARAITLYREALTIDPHFTLAWYGIYAAHKYSLVTVQAPKALKEMDEARDHILALTPDAWWAHAMRADEFMRQHSWAKAEEASRAALAAAPPTEVDALFTHATFLMHVGRIGEALDYILRASGADPLSLRASGYLQLFFDLARRPDDAQAEFERSQTLAGDRTRWEWAALLRVWSRPNADPASVRRQYIAALNPSRGFGEDLLAAIDRHEDARAILRKAFDNPAFQSPGRMTVIFLYADHFGDIDLALSAMRRSVIDLAKVNLEGLWWPFETSVRRDPRFKTLVRDIGLADYWSSSGKWGDFARPVGSDFEIHR